MVERGNHHIGKNPVAVQLYVPNTVIPNRQTSACSMHLDDQYRSPKTVKVIGVKEVKSLASLEYYFEDAKRSRGGDIIKFALDDRDADVALITYKTEEGNQSLLVILSPQS